MISILIQQRMTIFLNWPAGSAEAIILILLVCLLTASYTRVLDKNNPRRVPAHD